ncbi:MAG: VWA domain-containing protein [Haloplanus sp.]
MTSTDDDGLDATQDAVRTALVRFLGDLRAAGVEVSADGALTGATALGVVGFDAKAEARAALRAALVSRPEDVETFDRVFERFWSRIDEALDRDDDPLSGVDGDLAAPATPDRAPDPDDAETADAEGDDEDAEGDAGSVSWNVGTDEGADAASTGETARFSPVGTGERVEATSLADDDETEAAVRRLTAALRGTTGRRSSPGAPGRPDLRRAMRKSHATGGAILDVPERAPTASMVSGVVLVDVSRSVLDTVDRDFLVRVLRALTAEWSSVRTFLFDTDVTEVSDALAAPTPAATFRALERAEAAWGGGTQIGAALTTVRERYPTAVDRRTTVLVVSDGMETGDVSALEAGMTWLDRRARRTFWLNPLAAATTYEPTARGMAAALPHVDALFAFADPADVEDMARQLERRGPGGALGYQHDWRHGRAES